MVAHPFEASRQSLQICFQIMGIHRLGHFINAHGFVALEHVVAGTQVIDVRHVVIQRGKHQIAMGSRLDAYPIEVWAHRVITPCIVSVFPLSRVIERGTLHSTGISRFIAKPGPVPLQRPV